MSKIIKPPADLSRLEMLTESQLIKLGDKISAIYGAALDASINAGYGEFYREQMCEKANNGCRIAQHWLVVGEWYSQVVSEKQRRMKWHGSLKPTGRAEYLLQQLKASRR